MATTAPGTASPSGTASWKKSFNDSHPQWLRSEIRWLNNIGITYDTPPDKIEKAVSIIRGILADHEGMHPDFPPRAYFNGFNDWSLNILVVA